MHTVKFTAATAVVKWHHTKTLHDLKYYTTCQVQCDWFQLIPSCSIYSNTFSFSNWTETALLNLLTVKQQKEESVLVVLGAAFPDIPFDADDSCSSRKARPRLNITQRACSWRGLQAEQGFSTSHWQCVCYKWTHYERLKSCTAQESTRTRSLTLGRSP